VATTRQCDKCKHVPAVPVRVEPEGLPGWDIDLCNKCLSTVKNTGHAARAYGFRKTSLPPQPQG
jgi:hypothetical protein